MAETVSTVIAPLLGHTGQPSADNIDLSSKFSNPIVPGTLVQFYTSLGTFDVALTDTATPLTVANFLKYVNAGSYNGTVIHRNAVLATSAGGSPKTPADIVQGGGYNVVGGSLTHIKTNAAVNNEFSTATLQDVVGTIAMAKSGGNPNSATSEWFFNTSDNSSTLGAGNNGGFTTFGSVIGDGMKVVNALAALPTATLQFPKDPTTKKPIFDQLPVVGIPEAKAKKKNVVVPAGNLTFVNTVSVVSGTTFTAVSDNPLLVRPTISGKNLSFAYDSSKTGVANITVTATSADGSTATQTFAVSVPNSAASSQGPVAANDTPTKVFSNISTQINVIANDSDSVSALNPSTISFATTPAHGTAVLDSTTGLVNYTPTAGYTGPDSFIYTIADSAGTISSAATVSFNVVAAPVHIEIGTKTVSDLKYTEPDGTVAHLSVSNGSAVVTFVDSNVQLTTSGKHATATGSGATIASIAVTDAKNSKASLTISATGGTDGINTVGAITNGGPMEHIDGPHTTLVGNLNVGGLKNLVLSSTSISTLTIGDQVPNTSLFITNAADTTVIAAGNLRTVKSKAWTSASTVNSITATQIGKISTTGDFADSVHLTATGKHTLESAHIGGQLTSGAWSAAGDVGDIIAKSVASTWSFASTAKADLFQFGSDVSGAISAGPIETIDIKGNLNGALTVTTLKDIKVTGNVAGAVTATSLQNVKVSGNLSGAVTAGSIGTLNVSGNLTSAVKTTDAFAAKTTQLKSLTVGGSITNGTVVAVGNIGSVKAGALVGSSIYAGVDSGTVTANTFPTAAGNFIVAATIKSVNLGKTKPAFSNSKISADILPSLSLGIINSSNNGTAEGVAGHTIDSLKGTFATGTKLNLGHSALASAATLTTFLSKKNIALADFAIKII